MKQSGIDFEEFLKNYKEIGGNTMGYRSNVKLLISKKGFKKLEEQCLKSDDDCVRNMIKIDINGLDLFESSVDNTALPKDSIMLGWNYVKWYQNFKDVQAVENVLRELDDMVEEEPALIDEYFYKLIEIGEDGAIREETNDENEKFVSDFYVIQDFSM